MFELDSIISLHEYVFVDEAGFTVACIIYCLCCGQSPLAGPSTKT